MKPLARRFVVPVVFLLTLIISTPSPGFCAPGEGALRWADWLGFLSALWAPQGCSPEPVGGSATVTAPVQQHGCMVDPVGRCIEATAPTPTDNGCSVDPVGRCLD